MPWVYEDEDGVATEESQKQQASPAAKWIAVLTAVLGFLASISLAIPSSLAAVNTWLAFASWVRQRNPCPSQRLTIGADHSAALGNMRGLTT